MLSLFHNLRHFEGPHIDSVISFFGLLATRYFPMFYKFLSEIVFLFLVSFVFKIFRNVSHFILNPLLKEPLYSFFFNRNFVLFLQSCVKLFSYPPSQDSLLLLFRVSRVEWDWVLKVHNSLVPP